ncbi:hypothetical protein F4775DRAFT_606581 [Biscogniauxia sp. FL1348]|nr:hypothetical protein F4775DRAFT_606581 [Biscogniauxia sp. FL1348]
MPLRSPRVNSDDESAPEPTAPPRRVKWKRGMKAGAGQAAADLALDARQAWRVHQDGGASPAISIIWQQPPRWAGPRNEDGAANLAAHEKILAAQARLMGVWTVWVRRELHGAARRFGTVDVPRILVYVGLGADRVHWGGWWNCVEKRDRAGRPTGVPLRVWSRWDPKVPQGEFWSQGPPPRLPCGEGLKPGVPRWEGYVPHPCRGTRLEPILRLAFKPVGARERYFPPRQAWLGTKRSDRRKVRGLIAEGRAA